MLTKADRGHAWLEVDSQTTSATGKIKNVDPERYKDIRFISGPISDEFAANIPLITDATKEAFSEAYMGFKAKWWPATLQSPEILTAASHALRSGAMGLVAQRVILSGLPQTGGVTRRFTTHSSHLRLPNGSPPFEGVAQRPRSQNHQTRRRGLVPICQVSPRHRRPGARHRPPTA
ncbi:hypothetical protein BBO_07269 [Beauveria brongniartii RCEF 3172]|uniref:Alpha/beta hydrolase domain-containing protein n=1 Tax=Beauveria brongniartii RCEF 3172 TaxID=1081107 RepID=A0A166ZUP1_9HYPO|nr:hypothetical protein BBO_07269 [Beauveria brongniartii RCEF 3172]